MVAVVADVALVVVVVVVVGRNMENDPIEVEVNVAVPTGRHKRESCMAAAVDEESARGGNMASGLLQTGKGEILVVVIVLGIVVVKGVGSGVGKGVGWGVGSCVGWCVGKGVG